MRCEVRSHTMKSAKASAKRRQTPPNTAEQSLNEEEAMEHGMAGKSKEFMKAGAEVYQQV